MSTKKYLGNLLVEAGIITFKTLERALERQKGNGKRLGIVLEEMGVITEEELVEALAKQCGFKAVKDIASYTFPQDLLDLVPEDLAVQKLVFPLKQKDNMLAIAISDPFDNDTIDFLTRKNGLKIIPVLAARKHISAAIQKHYLNGKEPEENRLKVLVVDDSQQIATIIEVALQKEGFDVVVGYDGMQGLKLALTYKPDLVVCDSIMPRMDGFGLMQALKGNPATAGTPLILLTSKGSNEEEQKALESGFLDFIAKPVHPDRVVSRVKRAFTLIGKMKI